MKFKIPAFSKSEPSVEKNNSSKQLTKKAKLQIAISTAIAISICGLFIINFSNDQKIDTKTEKPSQVVEKKEVIYSTTLDNSVNSKNREIEIAYPLGLHKQTNTVFYAFNIINDLDIITIDPLGEAFPTESQKLNNLPSISLGSSNLAINLDSLPKQNYLIRLVTKSGAELLTTQHYYLSNNPFDRTVRLNNLKSGAYYLQALNLVTHATYVSTPFYLNSAGDIVSGQNISFERIDTENIFGLPENKEITPISLDEIPIVLNDRFVTEISDEESPFETQQ